MRTIIVGLSSSSVNHQINFCQLLPHSAPLVAPTTVGLVPKSSGVFWDGPGGMQPFITRRCSCQARVGEKVAKPNHMKTTSPALWRVRGAIWSGLKLVTFLHFNTRLISCATCVHYIHYMTNSIISTTPHTKLAHAWCIILVQLRIELE